MSILSLANKYNIPVSEIRTYWNKARQLSKSVHKETNYAYVLGVTTKLLESVSSSNTRVTDVLSPMSEAPSSTPTIINITESSGLVILSTNVGTFTYLPSTESVEFVNKLVKLQESVPTRVFKMLSEHATKLSVEYNQNYDELASTAYTSDNTMIDDSTTTASLNISSGVTPSDNKAKASVGSKVMSKGKKYTVVSIDTHDNAIIQDDTSGKYTILSVNDLTPE